MKKFILIFIAVLFSANAFPQYLKISDRLQNKMQSLNPLEYHRVLILLKDRVDIEFLDKELYRIDAPLNFRALTVINTLKSKVQQTQRSIVNYLNLQKQQGKSKEFIEFWITNMIFAEVTSDVVFDLSRMDVIEFIELDEKISYDKPLYENYLPSNIGAASAETGLRTIKANLLWNLGITGAGRTVMHIDTGVDGLHPSLSPRWWGNNGRHWYHSWFDPVSPFTTVPTDCESHGTHTMGILCGRNSFSGDTVGVAPDAYWMSAGVTECPGASYPSMNIAAYQWAIDPDSNSATMDMPDVISCSWQDPTLGGVSQCTSIYVSVLNAVEAAGIAVVFSAGNSGPNISTITPPKNISMDSVNTFCVGNVNGNTPPYLISSSSSRGPSICGGSGTLLIKPEVSAPGTNVRSTLPNNSYGLNTGTSMASPHAAGCIALLKQAAPNLTGKQLKAVLFSTCTDLGVPGEDNDYGKGLINVYSAIQKLGIFPLNVFNIQSPPSGSRIVSIPNSTEPVTISWDTSATCALYKWIFGNLTDPGRLAIPWYKNSLTITLGQLDVLLAGAGLAQGDSLAGQWDVWAIRTNPLDSLKSSNGPRALTLKRSIPVLTEFNLSTPLNGTTITTSLFNSSLINIHWTRSGQGTTYKWKFGSPSYTDIKLSLPSNGNGFDTSLFITNNVLDGILGGLGLNQGDSLAGQWSVWAYNENDSIKASQNYSLTLKRKVKGDLIVLYDSTSSGCRIARDSVEKNLTLLSATFDSYNRKGNTGTASISFRGYKKVLLLGEGRSVVSNVVKDSLKSYLASGGNTSLTKSRLIIFAEDIGYHLDRTGSIYIDSAFFRSVLGCQYVADRPGATGNRGLTGVIINSNISDSTTGNFPDILKKSLSVPANQLVNLYKFRLYPDSINAIGRNSSTYNTATMGVDIESLRPAGDSPSGSPVRRLLKGAMDFVDGLITSVTQTNSASIPLLYSLSQNYPNPFNPATKINFSIPNKGNVTLKIYDVLGKEVLTLVNETKTAGNFEVEFNAGSLASGAYFYRIESGDFREIKRMMLIK